jgi:hypothetical protein
MLSVSQRDVGTREYVVVGGVRLGRWWRFLDKIRHNNAEEPADPKSSHNSKDDRNEQGD